MSTETTRVPEPAQQWWEILGRNGAPLGIMIALSDHGDADEVRDRMREVVAFDPDMDIHSVGGPDLTPGVSIYTADGDLQYVLRLQGPAYSALELSAMANPQASFGGSVPAVIEPGEGSVARMVQAGRHLMGDLTGREHLALGSRMCGVGNQAIVDAMKLGSIDALDAVLQRANQKITKLVGLAVYAAVAAEHGEISGE